MKIYLKDSANLSKRWSVLGPRDDGLFDSFIHGAGNPRPFLSLMRGVPGFIGKHEDRFVLFVALSLLFALSSPRESRGHLEGLLKYHKWQNRASF